VRENASYAALLGVDDLDRFTLEAVAVLTMDVAPAGLTRHEH
jgi:hypothetical protein